MTVKKAKYNVWTYKESGFNSSGTLPPREILGSFEDDKTSFVHSFGLTENYIVIIQAPMHYDYLKFITAKSVIDTISWDDTTPTKFHIMDRKTGKIVNTISSSDGAWFVYHVLNAFENSDGNIVLDFSKYQNDTLITYGMYLENIVDNPRQYVPTYEQARLTRCIVNPQAGTSDCGSVIDKTFEMGTFNWEYKHMKPYQYAWGASFKDANLPWKHGESDFIDQIIKVDLMQNATVASWSRQGFFVCEPLFQQRPGAEREDDGVLLFVGFDSSKEESWLFFLNGTTLEEIASAPMEGRLAANFHGKWWPEGKDYVIGL